MILIPKPQKLIIADNPEFFYIPYDGKICLEPSCAAERLEDARLLQKEMARSVGFSLGITAGKNSGDSDSALAGDSSWAGAVVCGAKYPIRLGMDNAMEDDAYRLQISERGVTIAGGGRAGLFYGIQTLRQIMRQHGAALPCLTIEDRPEISNRGYYCDVTRGRIPTLEYLKQIADRMAFYKMNQLQLYIEHSFLFEDLSEVWRDDTPLSAQDILELDAYCRSLCIELVPSLSCFGHLYKVLRTRSFGELCELEDPEKAQFSFYDRMGHHTLNVTDERSFRFITGLIDEYLPLFTSRKFNIGADETFDLGKGKSRQQAEKLGIQRLYVDFVKRLCEYLVEKGRQPMFWGDIICSFPEAIQELPEETICLNWGYDPKQSDESIRRLSEVNARQYACPGVQGWNQFVNPLDDAYENISRMCAYAHQYGAEGVLTTDWGDFGHINHPDFSVPGMIYGAAFSWSGEILEREEINRQISALEYGDASGEFLALVAQVGRMKPFDWWNAVAYLEGHAQAPTMEGLAEAEREMERLSGIQRQLCAKAGALNDWGRNLLKPYLVAIDGIKLVQRIGLAVAECADGGGPRNMTDMSEITDRAKLAADLEEWYLHFKEVWRTVSREAELYRVGEVIFRYADRMRDIC